MKPIGVLLFCVLAGILLAFAFAREALWPSPTLFTKIPDDVLAIQPEIAAAADRYHARGGEYIWGENDCSVFVADYIAACGRTLPQRPTTQSMMNLALMRVVGFEQTKKSPAPGDILLYRYRNSNGEWRGHTGVVVWLNNRLWVAHNAASFRGLVIQDFQRFRSTMNRLTRGDPNLQRIYRRKDFEQWRRQFEERKKQIL